MCRFDFPKQLRKASPLFLPFAVSDYMLFIPKVTVRLQLRAPQTCQPHPFPHLTSIPARGY